MTTAPAEFKDALESALSKLVEQNPDEYFISVSFDVRRTTGARFWVAVGEKIVSSDKSLDGALAKIPINRQAEILSRLDKLKVEQDKLNAELKRITPEA